jgi:hypothetical protein
MRTTFVPAGTVSIGRSRAAKSLGGKGRQSRILAPELRSKTHSRPEHHTR